MPQLLVNSLIAGSIYALASSGLSLTYGLLRILNFAHGHLLMSGAYTFYWAHVQLELGLFMAVIVTLVITVLLALITLHVFIQPFITYALLLAFVTTLALSTLLESGVSMIFGVNVKSLSAGSSFQSISIYGVYITPIQIVIIVSALAVLCTLAFVIHLSAFGRRIRALSEAKHTAESLGINSLSNTRIVFTVACILAAYAGILIGYETNLQPTMGHSYTIKAFAAMILGGLGNIWGTIAGSYLLGLIENLSIGVECGGYSIPAGYKDAFAFLIILLVLLAKPQGLFRRRSRQT